MPVSIVSTTIMDKWQQFIDKVSELRFLKIKERQVNKFNRLLLKKQGNITWFSAVPPSLPQAESASPQVANTSVPQVGSFLAESAAQAASASSPKQIVTRQLTLWQATLTLLPRWRALIPRWSAPLSPRQVAPGQRELLRQPVPLCPSKQVVPRQSALTLPPADSTDPQAVSTCLPGR